MRFSEIIAIGIHDLFENGILRSILAGSQSGSTKEAIVFGIGFALCIIVSYLLGSVNTALVVSRCFFHDDVRKHGSGNAGATNVLRTYGKKAALITFAGDALKAVISVLFACILFGHPKNEYAYLYLFTAVYMSAFFCIFGHVFPIFSRFRGGKGFATLAGSILVLNPFLFLVLLALYIPMVLLSHFISLSSVVAALFYPLMLSTVGKLNTLHVPLGTDVLFAMMIALLITWAHRGNIKRIYEGNERKFYLKRKKVTPPEESQAEVSEENKE